MKLHKFRDLALTDGQTTAATLRSVRRSGDGYLLEIEDEDGNAAVLEFADSEVGGLMQKIAMARAKRVG